MFLGEVFDCGRLEDPENGRVDLSDGTTEGSEATYTCFQGYELKGVATRTCSRSGWSDKEPTCERKLSTDRNKKQTYSYSLSPSPPPSSLAVDCDVLDDPPFGLVTWDTTFFGGIATYSCFPGYFVDGRDQRRCEANGFWSGQPPVCQRKYCTFILSL